MNPSTASRFTVSWRLAGSTLSGFAGSSDSAGLPLAARQPWAAGNGNGTYSNPLFYREFEGPDPICLAIEAATAGLFCAPEDDVT